MIFFSFLIPFLLLCSRFFLNECEFSWIFQRFKIIPKLFHIWFDLHPIIWLFGHDYSNDYYHYHHHSIINNSNVIQRFLRSTKKKISVSFRLPFSKMVLIGPNDDDDDDHNDGTENSLVKKLMVPVMLDQWSVIFYSRFDSFIVWLIHLNSVSKSIELIDVFYLSFDFFIGLRLLMFIEHWNTVVFLCIRPPNHRQTERYLDLLPS